MQLLPRLALLLVSLIAAGTFLVAKETMTRFTTLQLGCFRITLSFLIVLPIYLGSRGRRRRPEPADWPRLALLGLCGVTINQLFFLHGIHLATPLDGALLYAFTPAMVLIAAVLWLGEQLTVLKTTGVVTALVGVLLVLSGHGLHLSSENLQGDLYLFVAVTAWSAYTLLGKPALRKYDPLTVITWSFGFGALSLLPVSPQVFITMDFAAPGWSGWLGLVYLSAVTSGVAFTLWYWALKRLEASQVAVFTNLQPPLTAALAWFFRGEVPGWQIIVGGLLVLFGVSCTQWQPRRTRPGPTPATQDAASRPSHDHR